MEEYGDVDPYRDFRNPNVPPKIPGIRPKVDPTAEGEVDPTLYPEPKEATHKIRGKSDILELLFGAVDQELLTVKTFYFFFYSAFGSLFPLMGVYFKQMGMNPTQCGFLVGLRPFVEFLSAPFWGSLADRWQKGKLLLIASLSAWIIFTLPLGFIQPAPTSCVERKNDSTIILRRPEVQRIFKRSVNNEDENLINWLSVLNQTHIDKIIKNDSNKHNEYRSNRFKRSSFRPWTYVPGKSPIPVDFAANYKEKENRFWVKPIFSTIVYRTDDIDKAFFLLILLVIIGEFFSAPAITLADSAVITILGEDADKYGHQRMFGSLGWGLAMFFVGIALDHSTAFPDHPCVPGPNEKNYTICFAIFSVLMGAALITATQIKFKYEEPKEETILTTTTTSIIPPLSQEEKLQAQLAAQLNLPSLADTSAPIQNAPVPEVKATLFAQTTREIPEWLEVLKHFKDLKCASFLFVAWFMGFGIGLIFTFLFWHLQDFGGSPTLFGVASVINHVSEIFAYFFSFQLIREMGHVKVLCLGLAGNVLRFLYISYLHNPWWVLPFEFMQGITHAAVWAACCSYIAHNTPQQLRSSAQGVLQGLHHGLGRGCGAIVGGIMVNCFGSTATFRAYGIMCLIVLGAFIFINFYRKEQGFVADIPTTEDPHQVAEETAHLAPHGVPSNPIPRALSSTRLHEISGQDSYGATYQTAGGNLGVPGAGGAVPAPTSGSTVYNPFNQPVTGGYVNPNETSNFQGRNY